MRVEGLFASGMRAPTVASRWLTCNQGNYKTTTKRQVASRWSSCKWHRVNNPSCESVCYLQVACMHPQLRVDDGLATRAITKLQNKNRPVASEGSICKWHASPHSCESMVDLQLGQLQTTTKKPSCKLMVKLQVASSKQP